MTRAMRRSSVVRHRRLRKPALGKARQHIDVADHELRFGDQRDWVTPPLHRLKNGPRDPVAPLDRLINVGDAAQHDRAWTIAGSREGALKQLHRARLDEQLRLEVEPWRQPHIGVVGPCVAIDAAMLAAAIRIDRLLERYVRARIGRNDRLRQFRRDDRLKGRDLVGAPPVVISLSREPFVAAIGVGARPSPPQWVLIHRDRTMFLFRTFQEHFACAVFFAAT